MAALPLRILVAADFTGASPAQGPPRPVSSDLGPLFEAFQPTVKDRTFRCLDDFGGDKESQTLEASWRGLAWLVERVPSGDAVRIEAFSTGSNGFVDRFRKEVYEPEWDQKSEAPLSVVLLDRDLSHVGRKMDSLLALARMARELQVPIVAGASPEVFGLKGAAMIPKLTDLSNRLAGPRYAGWREFQKDDDARWICLTLNQILLRGPGNPLWGRAVFPLGVTLAKAFVETGHCVNISGLTPNSVHENLITRNPGKDASTQLPTELIFPEERLSELARMGFTPLAGRKGGTDAYFPMPVNLHRPTFGKMTINATLSYHLFTGHLVHFLLNLSGKLSAGNAKQVLEDKVPKFLGRYAGAKPEESVKIELQTDPPVAHVRITPDLQIENKDVELSLGLPLQDSAS